MVPAYAELFYWPCLAVAQQNMLMFSRFPEVTSYVDDPLLLSWSEAATLRPSHTAPPIRPPFPPLLPFLRVAAVPREGR